MSGAKPNSNEMNEYTDNGVGSQDFSDENEWETILAEDASLLRQLWPDELKLYKKHFSDFFRKGQCWVKRGYTKDKPFILVRSKEKDTEGKRKPLYIFPELLDTYLEQHLDLDRWRRHHLTYNTRKDKTRPTDLFWFGLLPGKFTKLECFDNDINDRDTSKNDNIVGYYQPGTGMPVIPVVRPPLAYFQRLKTVHDRYPNRIFCISSETLGIHAWAKLPKLVDTRQNAGWRRLELARLGADMEVHPNLERCLRRPFGSHYRTITPDGILTGWLDQIRYFDQPGPAPTFETIFRAIREAIVCQHDCWERRGDTRKGVRADTRSLKDHWNQEVVPWFKVVTGQKVSAAVPGSARSPAEPARRPLHVEKKKPVTPSIQFDLATMRNRRWPLQLEKVVKEGLPHRGSVGPVCHEIAKWLYWIELYHLEEPERLKTVFRLIWRWLKKRHNDTISRGIDHKDVKRQVLRCCRLAQHIRLPESLELFARLRQKRQQGRYKHLVLLQPLLLAATGEAPTPTSLSSPSTYISVSSLETPLPPELLELIHSRSGRNKLDKYATYFVNFLYQNGGGAHMAREELKKWANNNPNQEKKYRDILVAANIIHAGTYYRKGTAHRDGQAKHYSLTQAAKEILDTARTVQNAVG